MMTRVNELEEELKRVKEELEESEGFIKELGELLQKEFPEEFTDFFDDNGIGHDFSAHDLVYEIIMKRMRHADKS